MKVSLQQVTLPTATGTYNVTDPAITSDWKGAIFFGGQPTVNGTTTAGMNYTIGACDANGHNACAAWGAQDATSGAVQNMLISAVQAYWNVTTSEGGKGAFSAAISNGVTIQQTGSSQSRLMNVLMFAGADVEFAVSSGLFVGGTTFVLTHNLTGTPDCVMLIGITSGGLETLATGAGMALGFYDGTNSVGFAGTVVTAANPTNVAARCGTANMGEYINQTPADAGTWSLTAVGASTMTVNRSVTGTANPFMAIAWRHLSQTSAASAYVDSTPASTGNNTPVTGLSVAPQLWLNLSTRLPSTAFANSDSAGSWGFSAAVNNAGTTQQYGIAGSFENGVSASSVAKSYVINNAASQTLGDTGTVVFSSTVVGWNSASLTENVVTAAAGERINLVYGISAAAGPQLPLAMFAQRRNQLFPIPT